MGDDCSSYEPNSDGVPIDLFVSKKTNSNNKSIIFTDSCSNLVFSVDPPPPPPRSDLHRFKRLVSDSSGTPILFISHHNQKQKQKQKASWEGYSNSDGNDPVLRVERTKKTFSRLQFDVFLTTGNHTSHFKMRGSPFYRSCTIYKADSIVAQTSLMYKLGIQQFLVPRNRFRLTIFPGYAAHHAFIVALTLIFFYDRKLWI